MDPGAANPATGGKNRRTAKQLVLRASIGGGGWGCGAVSRSTLATVQDGWSLPAHNWSCTSAWSRPSSQRRVRKLETDSEQRLRATSAKTVKPALSRGTRAPAVTCPDFRCAIGGRGGKRAKVISGRQRIHENLAKMIHYLARLCWRDRSPLGGKRKCGKPAIAYS